jgi:hypothetical protein
MRGMRIRRIRNKRSCGYLRIVAGIVVVLYDIHILLNYPHYLLNYHNFLNFSCFYHLFYYLYTNSHSHIIYFCSHALTIPTTFFDNFVLIKVDFVFNKYLKFVAFVNVNVFIIIYYVYLVEFDLLFLIKYEYSLKSRLDKSFDERFFDSI